VQYSIPACTENEPSSKILISGQKIIGQPSACRLHCTALHCTALHCTALNTACRILSFTIPPFYRTADIQCSISALHCIMQTQCSTVQCTAMQCSAVQCILYILCTYCTLGRDELDSLGSILANIHTCIHARKIVTTKLQKGPWEKVTKKNIEEEK
jgi:hypothetical protein